MQRNGIRILQDRLPVQRGAQAQAFGAGTTPARVPAARLLLKVLASGAPHNTLYSTLCDLDEYDPSGFLSIREPWEPQMSLL